MKNRGTTSTVRPTASRLSALAVLTLALIASVAGADRARADTGASDLAASASGTYAACSDRKPHDYVLGPSSKIDALYPKIATASMSAKDRAWAVAASIQFYLRDSLSRDRIVDACNVTVVPHGAAGYTVSFRSNDDKADRYGAIHAAWMSNGGLGLKGIQACQGDAKKSCWEPVGAKLTCAGPWQFYLPLGLPMVSQKMVMLMHYPPYVAMQQSDYLNNATLDRWQRLLLTVGVPADDWTLYATIVDIFPIAAPGSGESGCFPTGAAITYFGDKGSRYIPTMLNALVTASNQAAPQAPTIPVIVFGQEAIGYWNAAYPGAQTGVLQAGSVSLDSTNPAKQTPYIGANHPIAAVYQSCQPSGTQPGLIKMVTQDLSTACFAKAMAANPAANPKDVSQSCQDAYMAAEPKPDYAKQICVTAMIDKSPQYSRWSPERAGAWCSEHGNQACPAP